ncbi:MAG: thiamine pyrophosphate-binding protein, partial [Varibaculum timonense]
MTDAYLPSHLPSDNHNRQTADAGENMTESATILARETVSELVRAGVRDFVISPGSRSAPLTYALAALEQVGLVRTHVRLDERSAAFFALGLAKSGIYLQDSVKSRTETTGFEDGSRATLAATADSSTDLSAESCNNEGFTESYTPVALVVTSGTAVAELGAGIMETFHAGIPLVVLTADRPRAMRGTGANQTTWQEGIYGRCCPVALDIDATEDGVEESVEKIRCAVSRAWANVSGDLGQCSPVHINLCFAPPLVSSENWEIPQDLLQVESGEDAAIFP